MRTGDYVSVEAIARNRLGLFCTTTGQVSSYLRVYAATAMSDG